MKFDRERIEEVISAWAHKRPIALKRALRQGDVTRLIEVLEAEFAPEPTHCGYTMQQVVERTLKTGLLDDFEMLRIWWESIEPGSITEKEFKRWMRFEG